MGNINIAIATVGGPSGDTPAFNGGAISIETVATSGTSQQSTGEAENSSNVARIVADVAVYALSGQNPTASASTGWYIPANVTLDLCLNAGDKIAFIEA